MFIIFITRCALFFLFLGGLVQAVPPFLYTSHPEKKLKSYKGVDFWESRENAKSAALARKTGVIYTIDTGGIETMFSRRPYNRYEGEWEVKSKIPKESIALSEHFQSDGSLKTTHHGTPYSGPRVESPPAVLYCEEEPLQHFEDVCKNANFYKDNTVATMFLRPPNRVLTINTAGIEGIFIKESSGTWKARPKSIIPRENVVGILEFDRYGDRVYIDTSRKTDNIHPIRSYR